MSGLWSSQLGRPPSRPDEQLLPQHFHPCLARGTGGPLRERSAPYVFASPARRSRVRSPIASTALGSLGMNAADGASTPVRSHSRLSHGLLACFVHTKQDVEPITSLLKAPELYSEKSPLRRRSPLFLFSSAGPACCPCFRRMSDGHCIP